MCRAARILYQTSPQHCRVGWLCNNANAPPTTANTATGALSSAASCRGMNLAELLPPTNNNVQPVMGERRRTDPRQSESTGRKRRNMAGGKLPQEHRWMSRCLRLSFWAAALLDIAPHPSYSPCRLGKEAALPWGSEADPTGQSAPRLLPLQV